MPSTGFPWKAIIPALGWLRPVNNLRMVRLPQPPRPIKLIKESRLMERLISSKARTCFSPTVYVLYTPSGRKAVSLLCVLVKMETAPSGLL